MSDKGSKPAGRKAADSRRQVAALPWRGGGDALEILLVSSRETKRWVIPKGWTMKGKTPAQAAVQEAFEEAGVEGEIEPASIGAYDYLKRLKTGVARLVTVDVYPLRVTGEHALWPEKGQRTLKWMTPVEAALAVQEPQLRDLIARFAGVTLPELERPSPPPPPTPMALAIQRVSRRVTALLGRRRPR
ncbi:MAG: hydrolase [Caulobacter sp.]|nr:hydrolase [Caulobacter sp.]